MTLLLSEGRNARWVSFITWLQGGTPVLGGHGVLLTTSRWRGYRWPTPLATTELLHLQGRVPGQLWHSVCARRMEGPDGWRLSIPAGQQPEACCSTQPESAGVHQHPLGSIWKGHVVTLMLREPTPLRATDWEGERTWPTNERKAAVHGPFFRGCYLHG